jgi:peptide deformylase
MPSDEIVLYGEKVLREPAKPVDPKSEDLRELADHMIEVMKKSSGLGLAANQVGLDKQIFVYDVGEGPNIVLNPKIVRRKGSQTGVEGCLSVPGLQGDVKRANSVTVEGLDLDGNAVQVEGEGLLARVFQHEIDHLNGTLFIDRADPGTLEWVSDHETHEE